MRMPYLENYMVCRKHVMIILNPSTQLQPSYVKKKKEKAEKRREKKREKGNVRKQDHNPSCFRKSRSTLFLNLLIKVSKKF